jgi:uncharacterized membrane-anchored protein YhcB (DUF1043 family)
MPPPVKPADFKALIVEPEDTEAELIKKMMQVQILWSKMYRYMFDSAGNLTPEFASELCAIECGEDDEEEEETT